MGMGRCLPRSGEGHIETPRVIQEPDALVLVGTHTGQDNEVLLPALEGVHTGNLHFLKETVSHKPQPLLQLHPWGQHGQMLQVPSDGDTTRPSQGSSDRVGCMMPTLGAGTPQHKTTRAPHLPHAQDTVLSFH